MLLPMLLHVLLHLLLVALLVLLRMVLGMVVGVVLGMVLGMMLGMVLGRPRQCLLLLRYSNLAMISISTSKHELLHALLMSRQIVCLSVPFSLKFFVLFLLHALVHVGLAFFS